MVSRQEAGQVNEFIGRVKDVVFESDGFKNTRQFHITIEPTEVKVAGKTGMFHEWIPMSAKATDDSIPAGSVLDRYLQMVENLVPAAEKEKTVAGALGTMKGKTFRFKKMKLGRDYDGNKAKDYSTPVALIN